ncbi:flagellar brake protein [Haliovirga abyssi]|uniref:Pilus assembly protein PilZ n=1 Tax=Haliovirga abyssi TaxID=2996794 RepID=A0AAU9DD86_9FUSO|nr:flagellar brake domain-containing protein [Haliovirga abyssi]BDU51486.1 pilus assembly protein PilZ [Haliovirga abyssi]
MNIEDVIKIGNRIEIELPETKKGPYLTKIEDIDEKNDVHIGLPIEKGHVIPLRVGEMVRISEVKKDGVYGFSGKVVRRYLKPFSNFVLHYPEKIERLQRRNYVRIRMNVIATLKRKKENPENEEDKFEIIKGVSKNISGGGIYILVLNNLKMNDKFEIEFKLPNGVECKKIFGAIKRKDILEDDRGKRYGYGLEFVKINEKLRDRIISYLFKVQRDRRSKGIEL